MLFRSVTLSMLYGFAPQALILCHQVGRTIMRGTPATPVPSLQTMIGLYEAITHPVYPARVVGIALNLMSLTDAGEAKDYVQQVQAETGLPATDVVRYGAGSLVDAITRYKQERESLH